MEKEQHEITNFEDYRFTHNKKYLTISIYALGVIVLGAIAITLIFNIGYIKSEFMKLMSTLSSFVGAFFIAYFLNPIVIFVYNKIFTPLFKGKKDNIAKLLSILITYIFAIGLIAVILTSVIPQFVSQFFTSFSSITSEENLSNIYEKMNNFFIAINEKLPYFDWTSVQNQIIDYVPQLIKASTTAITEYFPKLIGLSISIIKLFINILLSIVVSCYMISDKNIIKKNVKKLIYAIFQKERAKNICQTIRECNHILYSFVIGKAIDSLIIGIICFIITSLLKVPYSLLISVIVGVTNMIPYFGPFLGAIPCIIILLLTDPIYGLIFGVFVFILQQFDGLYLGPKILGDSVGVRPLWIIFAITVGGSYGGLIGMFLGVPITAICAHLINKFINNRFKKNNIDENEI